MLSDLLRIFHSGERIKKYRDSLDACGQKPYPERKSCRFKDIWICVDGALICRFVFQEVFKDSVSFEKFCSYLQRLQSPSREFIQLLFDWVGINFKLNIIISYNIIFNIIPLSVQSVPHGKAIQCKVVKNEGMRIIK